jgi:hypothetical protein
MLWNGISRLGCKTFVTEYCDSVKELLSTGAEIETTAMSVSKLVLRPFV